MPSKRRGLPSSLKSKPRPANHHLVDEISQITKTTIIRNIPIERITANSQQPRKDFGDLEELSASITEKGIIEPILVRSKNGGFELVAGERRYRAAKLAGITEVPCVQLDISDDETLEISIIENIQRKDLNVFEIANTLCALSELYGYTHEEISKKISKSRVTVSELIKISELPEEIAKECLSIGILSKSFILELAKIENIKEIKAILKQYKENPFSRDDLKQYRKVKNNSEEEKPAREDQKIEKPIKFKFLSEDKNIKINFNILNKNIKKTEIIGILQNLIKEIKENKIGNFEG